jgi:hypothetical protein
MIARRQQFVEHLAATADRGCSAVNCAILTIALIVGSMQPLLGIAIYQDSAPAFTLDICHPVQGLDHTIAAPVLALPAAPGRFVPLDFDKVAEAVFYPLTGFVADIDPPPPKPAALT